MTERWLWQRLGGEDRPAVVTSWQRRVLHYPHDHDFMELTLIVGGRGRHRCAMADLELVAGDVLLLGPGVVHEYHHCQELEGLDCCFRPELLHRELAWLIADPLVGSLLWGDRRGQRRHGLVQVRLDPPEAQRAGGLCRSIHALRRSPAAAARAEIIGLLTQLLGLVARAAAADEDAPEADEGGRHPAVAAALRTLADGLAEEWSLDRLATRVGLEPARLARRFRAAVGLPPMAYLARLRAERAASLLLRTSEAVAGIGAAVGWSDPNYCARRFREHFGCSPSEYRRRFAAEQPADPAAPPPTGP